MQMQMLTPPINDRGLSSGWRLDLWEKSWWIWLFIAGPYPNWQALNGHSKPPHIFYNSFIINKQELRRLLVLSCEIRLIVNTVPVCYSYSASPYRGNLEHRNPVNPRTAETWTTREQMVFESLCAFTLHDGFTVWARGRKATTMWLSLLHICPLIFSVYPLIKTLFKSIVHLDRPFGYTRTFYVFSAINFCWFHLWEFVFTNVSTAH